MKGISARRRGRRTRRGVSNIIAALFLVAITLVAGTALWTLTFQFPAPTMRITYVAHAGLKVPAWGDPTDCVPFGYPRGPSNSWSSAESRAANYYCFSNQIGNFSTINASEFVVTSIMPSNLALSQISFYFLCHNTTPIAQTTVLVGGSLSAMTWFPGSSTTPAPNAPKLGVCGTFNPTRNGGAFGTLYNRLAIFVPVRMGVSVLEPGDTLVLYIHTPGSVYDPYENGGAGGPDTDDFHGAPAWCFTTPGSCEIKLIYTGTPSEVLADIPLYSISGAGE